MPSFSVCSVSSTPTCSQNTISNVSDSVTQNDLVTTVSTVLRSGDPARDLDYYTLVMRSIANNILYDNHCIWLDDRLNFFMDRSIDRARNFVENTVDNNHLAKHCQYIDHSFHSRQSTNPEIIEYLDLSYDNKLLDFFNYYSMEMCPSFYIIDNSTLNTNSMDLVTRGLSPNLAYLPGLIPAIIIGLLSIAITVIIFGANKNKNLFATRLYSSLKILFLFLIGIVSLLPKLFRIKWLDRLISRCVILEVHKLQDAKKSLVSNITYILGKIVDINPQYSITPDEANNLYHDEDFKKRFDDLTANIHSIKRLQWVILPFYFYFKVFGFSTVQSGKDIVLFMGSQGPLIYNSKVTTALTQFRELHYLLKNGGFAECDPNFFKELDTNDFIVDEIYNNLFL